MRISAPPPPPFDTPAEGPLVLRDGSVAAVRTAGPADLDRLRAFFHDLSPESRYHRFFTTGEPSKEVLERLCRPPDPAEGVTLLALRTTEGREQLLGTASYHRAGDTAAEVAFAVADRHGHLGIATGLLERLAAIAREAGFEQFQATTLADNAAMLQVFRDSGFMIRSKLAGTTIDVELSLMPSARAVALVERREHLATSASIRPLLRPSAVAVVGASRDPRALGRRIFDAIRAAGYRGPVYPVNPYADQIGGRPARRSARDLPRGVDLAVLAIPRDAVPAAVDDCAAAGVRSIVVITAGFAETGPEGRALQNELVAKVRGYGMRMVGPNCLGLIDTTVSLNASFSPTFPPRGPVAFSSQSGALGIAILSLAAERQIGLSTFVSVGNKADVSSNDLLQFWEDDPATSVILLYLESFGNPRRFARLARRIGARKPIVAVKAGRSPAGSRAAGSHTAALAASEMAVDALFRQSGVIRADTIDDMFDIASCLAAQPLPAGRRLAVVTNAGGPGILAVDASTAAGLILPEFSAALQVRLRQFLSASASVGNPVDMIASAGPDDYQRTIEATLASGEVDALLVIYTPVDASNSGVILEAIARGVAAARQAGAASQPVLACVMGEAGHTVALPSEAERIPTYRFPENAVRALGRLAAYADWRAQPPGLFWSFSDIHADEARALCRRITRERGASWLTIEETQRVAHAFGLPLVPSMLARTGEEAAALADTVGYPVAAKLSASGLLHKSDVDGVRLNLDDRDAVRHAFDELTAGARARLLGESVEGVLIQPMITGGIETLVGATDDPLFGPLIAVGLGGIYVEAMDAVRFRLAPLTDRDADELLRSIPGYRVLEGVRGRPRCDIEALADVVLRVSRLAEDIPEIQELDLNPVMVLPAGAGCRIVDARMKVAPQPATWTPGSSAA